MRYVLTENDFCHLVAGGTLRITNDKEVTEIILSDMGFAQMSTLILHVSCQDTNKLGVVLEVDGTIRGI